MKNRISIYFIFCILLLPVTIFGQKNSIPESEDLQKSLNNERIIEFNNSSNTDIVIINIKEYTPTFDLRINGIIDKGKLKIKVIDPDGALQATFKLLSSRKNNIEKPATALFSKSLSEPQPGDWKIEISPSRANGQIKIQLNFENDYYIFVPEKFSPNGDNHNNILRLKTHNMSDTIDFKIYNRWGNLVFEATDTNKIWDGMYNGELLPHGTYYYVIRAKTTFGHEVVKNGVIDLTE